MPDLVLQMIQKILFNKFDHSNSNSVVLIFLVHQNINIWRTTSIVPSIIPPALASLSVDKNFNLTFHTHTNYTPERSLGGGIGITLSVFLSVRLSRVNLTLTITF